MNINKRALIFWIIFFTYFTLFYLDILFIRILTGILLLLITFSTCGLIGIDSIFGTDLLMTTIYKVFDFFD